MSNEIIKKEEVPMAFFQKAQNSKVRTVVVAVLGAASEIYGKEITKTMVNVYIEVLDGYPQDKIREAFFAHCGDGSRSQFFPKPGDIVYQIQEKRRRNIA
jgi:hypothetical protein